MRTRSSSNLVGNSSSNPTTSNPKRHNRRRSNQIVEPFALEESPVVTMADQRTMAELLRAPTEGYKEAIVVPPILAEHFELKNSLINMMTSDQFFRLEKDNHHDHIRWFNKITSTIKYKDVPNSAIKLMLFPLFSCGQPVVSLKKNPLVLFSLGKILCPNSSTNSFPPQERQTFEMKFLIFNTTVYNRSRCIGIKYKDPLRACPLHGFTELHQLDTFYNALNPCRTTSPPASVKAVEEICVTCGGAHPYYLCVAADGNTFPEYRDNIQGYVAASNDGNYKSGISDALSRPYNEDKNVKKITNASLILEDFNPPLYELPFHKEVPGLRILLSFSSKNEENVFNPGILTSKRVHTSFLPELSHRGPKAFKVIKIFESPMEIFPCSHGENIPYLDVPCLHFYPP
ncbi:hypothetical protein Tco_0037715 [Tanacetum coccineum]